MDAAAIALKKQINSEDQLAQAMKGIGEPIAVGDKIKDVNRLIAEYGGNVSDWAKMTSKSYTAPDGQQISTHWYQNYDLDLNVEFKSIATEWSKNAGIKLFKGGAIILGGLAVAAEVLDPTTYIYSGGGVPPGATETWFGYTHSDNSANGGFVLYPNKPNTNMMKSVYAK
ncbi:hypothetical protein AADEFJLK_04667 [Methylovulum psychrotolerans]|uniref:Uncharacterized protein n=1 Tax=Methylovulum psychrotolerans TaxID=1704499 RepID=A0A2S5CFH9_9GAMM|nr:hypothetical protein AADEFJLK_04667 [Methylovulum psychrotolerans]